MNRFTSNFVALALALLVAVALIPVGAFGQAISGNVTGTVTDPSGAVVANAVVQAQNVATGLTSSTKINGTGWYRFDNLPVGMYKLTVSSQGFKSVAQQVDVQLNKTGTLNVTMSPGAATETVEV